MSSDRPLPDSTAFLIRYKKQYLAENAGILAEVARRLQVTRQTVRLVYYGRKSSKRVERALRRRGIIVPQDPRVRAALRRAA